MFVWTQKIRANREAQPEAANTREQQTRKHPYKETSMESRAKSSKELISLGAFS